MASPRTLDALRSAVARVLTARGEAPDALRVTAWPLASFADSQWMARVSTGSYAAHPLESVGGGDTEAAAVAAAWSQFVGRLAADVSRAKRETDIAQEICDAAHRHERAVRAALTAARAVEAGG